MSGTDLAVRSTSLLAQPEAIREAWTLADRISTTDLVPKSFRGKPEVTFAAMLRCHELGLPVLSGMGMLWATPDGKIGVETRGMVAVVQGAGHEIWTEESSPERVIVCGRRAGSKNVERVVWDMKRAQRAGLGNKQVWKNYPEEMLWARAASTVCRRIAADALAGIDGSAEELRDDEPETVTRAARGKAAAPAEEPERRTITTKATPAAAPTPAPGWGDEEPVDAEIVEDVAEETPQAPATASGGGEPITDKQVRMISALFGGIKYDDAAIDATIASLTDGRTTSRKDLTKDEASQLIDELQALAKGGE
jgi:hypothetical protein